MRFVKITIVVIAILFSSSILIDINYLTKWKGHRVEYVKQIDVSSYKSSASYYLCEIELENSKIVTDTSNFWIIESLDSIEVQESLIYKQPHKIRYPINNQKHTFELDYYIGNGKNIFPLLLFATAIFSVITKNKRHEEISLYGLFILSAYIILSLLF